MCVCLWNANRPTDVRPREQQVGRLTGGELLRNDELILVEPPQGSRAAPLCCRMAAGSCGDLKSSHIMTDSLHSLMRAAHLEFFLVFYKLSCSLIPKLGPIRTWLLFWLPSEPKSNKLRTKRNRLLISSLITGYRFHENKEPAHTEVRGL